MALQTKRCRWSSLAGRCEWHIGCLIPSCVFHVGEMTFLTAENRPCACVDSFLAEMMKTMQI
jgi:hypothetical protein